MQLHLMDVAKQQKSVSGSLCLDALPRITESLITHGTTPDRIQATQIQYTVSGIAPRFFGDAALPMLQLRLEVQLPMVCQRCFEALPHAIDESYLYALSEHAPEALLEDELVEWLGLDDLQLEHLVEDELLMAQPISVLHAHACTTETTPNVAKPNPFAVLAQLKSNQ